MKTPFLAVLLAVVAASELVAQSEITDRDRRAALTIFETIRLRRQAGAPDDSTIQQYKRDCAEEVGETLCYTSPDVREGGQMFRWNARVTFLPADFKPNPASEARWEQRRFLPDDEATGAQIYFQSGTDPQRPRTQITFKVRRGQTQLVFNDIRSDNRSPSEHARLAQERWRFLVQSAQLNRLFQAAPPELVGAPNLIIMVGWPDPETTQQIVDGGVFSFDSDPAGKAELTLTAWLDLPAEDLPRGESLRVGMDDAGRRHAMIEIDGSVPVPGFDGMIELPITARRPTAALTVTFLPLAQSPDAPDDQRVMLTFTHPRSGVGATITLHRTTWFPVIRRFEIVDIGPGARHGAVTGTIDPKLERGWTHNEYRIHAGNMLAAWRQLEPDARIRPAYDDGAPERLRHGDDVGNAFSPEEPVLLGWQIDRETQADFLTAENSPASRNNTLASWGEGVTKSIEVDVWIYRPTAPAGRKFGAGDEEADDPDAPFKTAEEIRREQEEMRRWFVVEDLRMDVVAVTDETAGLHGGEDQAEAARVAERLAELLRRPAGGWAAFQGGPVLHVQDTDHRLRWFSDYSGILPLGAYSRANTFQCRHPGIYEARFILTLKRDGQSTSRSVASAIRFNVVEDGFQVKVLEWKTRPGAR